MFNVYKFCVIPRENKAFSVLSICASMFEHVYNVVIEGSALSKVNDSKVTFLHLHQAVRLSA